jgi:hypothetical protein
MIWIVAIKSFLVEWSIPTGTNVLNLNKLECLPLAIYEELPRTTQNKSKFITEVFFYKHLKNNNPVNNNEY